MDSLAQAKELLKKGLDPSLFATPLEKSLKIGDTRKALTIGVPKEHLFQERRVSLTPGSVAVLVANGHEVMIEHNAGAASHFSDRDYSEAGAKIAYTPQEVFTNNEIIVKIAPPNQTELDFCQTRQTLISAVHIANLTSEYLKVLINKNITALGFEFLLATDGSTPLVRMMSEIAGISSIHIASELLSSHPNAKGILLGGITGVPPATVTIIGAGTAGFYACRTALGLGASVKVIDEEIHKLKRLEEVLGQKIYTAVSQQDYIANAVAGSDVLIGAAFKKGARASCLVSDAMVQLMPEGSVIVDVAIDQGGCIETSRITTHENPTYLEHGVIHYCVPNIASRVARTASQSISNILGPLVLKIGEAGGIKNIIATNRNIKSGIYVYHKHITQRSLATMLNLDWMDIDLLHAAQL